MKLYPRMPPCSKAAQFHKKQPDSQYLGVTDEVGDLLYALVRMTKPEVCLETGTHVGDSAERIGQALRDNDRGSLLTCDTDANMVARSLERLRGLPVILHQLTGEDLIRSVSWMIDFAFIDSGDVHVRSRELALLGAHNISPLGIVAIHDICVDYQQLYDEFEKRDWPHLVFPSIVGIAVFQRPE